MASFVFDSVKDKVANGTINFVATQILVLKLNGLMYLIMRLQIHQIIIII